MLGRWGGQISRNIQQQAILPMKGKEISYCSEERGQLSERSSTRTELWKWGDRKQKQPLDDRT